MKFCIILFCVSSALIALPTPARGLMCYQCDSADNTGCGHPFNPEGLENVECDGPCAKVEQSQDSVITSIMRRCDMECLPASGTDPEGVTTTTTCCSTELCNGDVTPTSTTATDDTTAEQTTGEQEVTTPSPPEETTNGAPGLAKGALMLASSVACLLIALRMNDY